MTREQLVWGILEASDFEPGELKPFIDAGGEDETLARDALLRTRLRQTVDVLSDKLAAGGYADAQGLELLAHLAPIAQNEEPVARAHKYLGLRAAGDQRFDEALAHLEAMGSIGARAGLQMDARSRRALRYTRDAEADQAISSLAKYVPALRPPAELDASMLILVSSLVEESATTRLVVPMAQWMTSRGYRIVVASTEFGVSTSSATIQKLAGRGVPVMLAQGRSHRHRIESLLNQINAAPCALAFFMAWTPDVVAKILACSGVAAKQAFFNHTVEQFCGRFDLIVQTVSPDQIVASVDPAASRFVGAPAFMQAEIEGARALSRTELALPEDAVLLGTFGRLTKMANPRYVRAMAAILRAAPNAHLLIAGGQDAVATRALQSGFQAAGVDDRVTFLVDRAADAASLMMTLDLYCDTFPWCGGQTILEAMTAGTPVVAMEGGPDADLDPTGTGPRVACAKAFLEGLTPLAPLRDDDAYVALALEFIASPQMRNETGLRLRTRARERHGFDRFMERFESAAREFLSPNERLEHGDDVVDIR